MKTTTHTYIALLGLLLISQSVCSQQNWPVIKATSKKIDIKDDDVLKKDAWTIVPEARPDVYLTSAKKVTFYTDLENMSFKVDPKVGT